MEKSESKLGLASALIGILNPIICFAFVFKSSDTVQQIFFLVVPVIGIFLGVIGLFTFQAKRATSIIGIILNLLPFGFILLLIVAFKNGSGGFGSFK